MKKKNENKKIKKISQNEINLLRLPMTSLNACTQENRFTFNFKFNGI